MVYFLTIIYWWNPACTILSKRIKLLLEMNVDQFVTRGNANAIKEYVECLLFIKKEALLFASETLPPAEMRANYLLRSHDDSLERRVAMLLKKPSPFRKACVNVLFTVLITFILVLSHLYIFETRYYVPSSNNETFFYATSENAYFIVDEFSRYNLYVNEIHIDTVTSLEYYPHGIKIYNQEGELIGET